MKFINKRKKRITGTAIIITINAAIKHKNMSDEMKIRRNKYVM
jgi:hypothetical protein